MALDCPECRHRIGRWQLLGFLRLVSVACPGCGSLLILDNRSRSALFASALAAIPLALVLNRLTGWEIAVAAGLIGALFLGSLAVERTATLRRSPEDSRR